MALWKYVMEHHEITHYVSTPASKWRYKYLLFYVSWYRDKQLVVENMKYLLNYAFLTNFRKILLTLSILHNH